ncbi:MAG: hypothetical protein HRU26_01975 [Psychroserpens sp.]|nr:hypothetical protein [Psychroserpens sp.]
MKRFINICIVISVLILTACGNDTCKDAVNGTIKNLEGLDGCGMVIQLENDKVIIPSNLEEFDLDFAEGLSISVAYTAQPDMMGICMAGEIVSIDCITIN